MEWRYARVVSLMGDQDAAPAPEQKAPQAQAHVEVMGNKGCDQAVVSAGPL
jgi:hypothetical protein